MVSNVIIENVCMGQGVATMALESPYYGSRRPPWQEGSKLARVSDLLTLGRTTIEESLYLLAWAQQQNFQRLGEPWRSVYQSDHTKPQVVLITSCWKEDFDTWVDSSP